jgi:tetratricopeptide (TPR) repeat protein
MRNLSLLFLMLFSAPVFAAPNDCEQALEAGDAAKAVSAAEQSMKSDKSAREAYLCLGRAQEELGQYDAALLALQAAEKLSAQPVERMVALTLQGNVLRTAKKTAQAGSLYRQSLQIALNEKSAAFELINRNQLGVVLQESGDTAAALEQFQMGLKVAANDNERADSHARIAGAQSLLGQHDKAIEHQLKSALYEEKAGDFNHYANAMLELGRICLVGKQYADAEKWINKFLGTIMEAGDSYWQARARFLLGQVKSAKGEGSAAKEQWTQAKAMAERIGARQLLAEIVQSEPSM